MSARAQAGRRPLSRLQEIRGKVASELREDDPPTTPERAILLKMGTVVEMGMMIGTRTRTKMDLKPYAKPFLQIPQEIKQLGDGIV